MASAVPIEFFNRYTGRFDHEPIYGERWLRWVYETAPGRLALWLVVKRAWFSRHYGRKMSHPRSAAQIAPFIRKYGLDPTEFLDPPESFRSFNEFFVRRLNPSARPLPADPATVIFPADARHLGFANVELTRDFYAKGQRFDVGALLQDPDLAARFARGAMVISRLCPLDYHRFHFPVAGRASAPRPIAGPLISVNPIALRRSLRALVENKRVITTIATPDLGDVLMIEIGATCVGTIAQTAPPGPVARGEEKGYFAFGGSCVITLFEPGRVRLADDLLQHSTNGIELYARMGDHLARPA
jgi:phosphatidylserine decarboxylase